MPCKKLIVIGLISVVPVARASLWESDNWALTGLMSASTGYDSNLTLSHDGQGDFFVLANPSVTLARSNSSTELQIVGGVTETEFINNREPTQTDYSFDAVFAYPNTDNVIPIYRAEASWLRSSQPDPYVGARIRYEQVAVNTEGYMPMTSKLGLRGTLDYASTDYDSILLNQNRHGDAFIGLAYQRDPLTEISLNLGGAFGRSEPKNPARSFDDVRSTEFYATARVRGQLTAKLSGSIYAGLGQVRYTGGYTNRETLPVGGADLTWTADPHRTIVLAVYSGENYAPDGETANTTRASLAFTHKIIERWQYVLHGGVAHSSYYRVNRDRTDDTWNLGTDFAYQPSTRFRASLGVTYTNQTSDISVAAFTHAVVSLTASYQF
jgi:hypothetical protein